MSDDRILEQLRQVMRRSSQQAGHTVDWNTITLSSTIQDMGFDSLTMLDLIYDIQQDFKVEFEAEAMVGIRTVADLVAFLKARGAGGAGGDPATA